MKRCPSFIEANPPSRKHGESVPFSRFAYPASNPKQFLLRDGRIAIFHATEDEAELSNCAAPFIEYAEEPAGTREYHGVKFFFTEDGATAFAYLPIKAISLRGGMQAIFRDET
ncbi:MAG: hypothetical protein LBU11_13290 [Zoogloeaceae bacterium]|jgi:hypothetical protein|nr:hypothetical protein [Zoogloeaceae bacterium]